jgi:hypothetical protein
VDNHEKARVRKHITRLVKHKMLSGRRIVLFGASVFSKDILACLNEFGFSANAIVDNDSRKHGIRCLGMIVQKPEDALSPFDCGNVILFYSPAFSREITAQLERMGYKKRRHIFVMNRVFGDSLLNFAEVTFYMLRGLWWYRKITRGHAPDCKIFIAPYTGTGDIYLAGLFFGEYCRRYNVTDYVFAVVSDACRKTAEMFGIQHIVVLPHQISDDIITLERSTGGNLDIVTLNDGWLGDPLQWLRGYKRLNFEKMFRYFVFGFGDDVPRELPSRKDYGTEIDALFEKYGLRKGKTVVLSPYSNTLFDLPDDVLAAIVEHCQERGFTVCTNCAGTEKSVTGTVAVFFPLNQAIAFMDAAGYFVGVRSGLCDIISSSTCKKIILYEKDGLFYKSSQYEYFSLAKMGLCDDAVEIEYRDDLKDECLRAIFDAINARRV